MVVVAEKLGRGGARRRISWMVGSQRHRGPRGTRNWGRRVEDGSQTWKALGRSLVLCFGGRRYGARGSIVIDATRNGRASSLPHWPPMGMVERRTSFRSTARACHHVVDCRRRGSPGKVPPGSGVVTLLVLHVLKAKSKHVSQRQISGGLAAQVGSCQSCGILSMQSQFQASSRCFMDSGVPRRGCGGSGTEGGQNWED
jgi:hypothetical protein